MSNGDIIVMGLRQGRRGGKGGDQLGVRLSLQPSLLWDEARGCGETASQSP